MGINVMAATGHLGRKIVQSLLDRGVGSTDLIASCRTPEKARDLQARGVTVRRADYEEPSLLAAAFRGTEVLVIIPSIAPVEQRIVQHFNALEAAKESGVKRVVFVSLATAAFPSSRFSITPFFLYAESKLRLSGMDWTILRNNLYLDPIADWVPELVTMGRLPYPVKEGRVAFVSRDDLARATAAVCINTGHSEKMYSLTGSAGLSMPQVAEIISRVTGRSVSFDSVTEQEYADVCRRGNEQVPEYLIEILITLYRAVDNKEFENVTDHIEQLTTAPPENAESFLSRTVNVF